MRRLCLVASLASFVCALAACGDVETANPAPSAGANQAQNGTCVTIDQDVHIDSPADLTRFARLGCFDINGSLAVRSPTVRTLDALSGLRSVSSAVSIYDNPRLESIDGLSSLEQVGRHFDIAGNPALEAVRLASLESVAGSLKIYRNGGDFSSEGPGLQLIELSSLRSTGGFLITGNRGLRSIRVPNLASVDGSFRITRQEDITQIRLPSLETVAALFEISHSFRDLTTVDAPVLRTIGGSLLVERNADLERFSAPGLESVGGDFTIQFNRNLAECEMEALAASVATIGGEVIVLENDYSADCPGDGCIIDGGLVIDDRQDIQDFQATGCTTIVGDVVVEGTSLQDFSGMENLRVVDGEFFIRENRRLTSLRGLQNMRIAKRLWIEENPRLASLSGLDSLEFTHFLQIRDNASLASLAGLELLESAGRLILEGNPALVSIEALLELRETHKLVIRDNQSLPDVDGLDNLRQVVGNFALEEGLLIIENNPNLINIEGFNSLTTIRGGIRIINNDALERLTGLSPFRGLLFELVIVDNDTLPTCEALILQSLIASDFTDVVISGNDDTGVCL
ncbi:hypothetical protein FIV42_23650 [Persicimonas caeni]|uniref:Receptor L-domain domain-containing protein n=1 Tax=Persicimonas caeni TaxID=2292766 RepID=A0A4Y6PZL8_PERCE|nr:hypothetical protein [Persicimonas caeni]QDG53629.1 hypothetical protein FIV42_23650 [Persicimonas caeni]QED34850.1 hypothetical protein FRD00_23645 [Persicimonas caeni]